MLVFSGVVGAAVAALASRGLGGALGLDVEKVNVSDQVQGMTWQEGTDHDVDVFVGQDEGTRTGSTTLYTRFPLPNRTCDFIRKIRWR
jgi:hypothetical protein